MDDNKVKVLKALEIDNDGEVVYEEAFYIKKEDLDKLVKDIMGDDFTDADDFLSDYEPEIDGVDIYEAAKERGIEVEDYVEDEFNELGEELSLDDIDGFESLDDMEFGEEEELDIPDDDEDDTDVDE
jgi:hypothetical protein